MYPAIVSADCNDVLNAALVYVAPEYEAMLAEFAAIASEINVGLAAAQIRADVLSAVGQTGTVIAVILPPEIVATT